MVDFSCCLFRLGYAEGLQLPDLEDSMRLSLFLTLSALQLFFHSGICAQQAATLSPPVQKYVRVNTPRVVLQHVRVIDGTGQPPVEDQNLIIEQGKIASVQASSETPAADGTTVLNLRGYTTEREKNGPLFPKRHQIKHLEFIVS
jgi:hypothetical protein